MRRPTVSPGWFGEQVPLKSERLISNSVCHRRFEKSNGHLPGARNGSSCGSKFRSRSASPISNYAWPSNDFPFAAGPKTFGTYTDLLATFSIG